MDQSSTVLKVGYDLSGIQDPAEAFAAVAGTLDGVFSSDFTGWVAWRPADPAVIARWPDDEDARRALGRHLAASTHPVLEAFRSGSGGRAIRTSDLVDRGARSSGAVFADLYRLWGVRYQLVLPPMRLSATTVSTWALHRESRDFSDDDLGLVSALAPLLALVDRGVWPRVDRSSENPLTARETEVLQLLSAGLTRTQIASTTRISDRTVGKHIEHIYAKLDVHDRLGAARTAARLGLVAE